MLRRREYIFDWKYNDLLDYAQFKACMEFFLSFYKSVCICPTMCTVSRAGAACIKIRMVQKVQAEQQISPYRWGQRVSSQLCVPDVAAEYGGCKFEEKVQESRQQLRKQEKTSLFQVIINNCTSVIMVRSWRSTSRLVTAQCSKAPLLLVA